jgi:hypothetical protein
MFLPLKVPFLGKFFHVGGPYFMVPPNFTINCLLLVLGRSIGKMLLRAESNLYENDSSGGVLCGESITRIFEP